MSHSGPMLNMTSNAALYLTGSAAVRDRFILDRRLPRPSHDPWRYQDVIVEDERAADGGVAPTATVFLTGRECPWRCVMCDLWRSTTAEDSPPGAIPAQVAAARGRLTRDHPPISQLKLYNAGSFFDPRAVPDQDYPAIARALDGLSRVVVESHPALIGERVDRWLEALDAQSAGRRPPQLEVAMGLETVHPEALARLHKRMTVAQFADAARGLSRRRIALRVFLLIAPPFVADDRQQAWLLESVETAFACGAAVVTLIPTRTGNGALDALAAAGLFHPPTLDTIEHGVEAAFVRVRQRGRLFVDVWDLERFADCPACFAARRDRLHTMNLEQRMAPAIVCGEHDAVFRRHDRS